MAVVPQGKRDLADVDEPEITATLLPPNYDFEVGKTLAKIRSTKATHVVLQFPEGLLVFAQPLAAIFESFANVEVSILGDVTYGACCIDDLVATALGATLVVHYGHSCLVPVTQTPGVHFLYVFVSINVDHGHFVASITSNLPPGGSWGRRLALMGTIQFAPLLRAALPCLQAAYGADNVEIPKEAPLTSGEVLGCTSPQLCGSKSSGGCCSSKDVDVESLPRSAGGVDVVVFVADGRFHLEAALIHNPHIRFVRYDPVTKRLFEEKYDHEELVSRRRAAVERARGARTIGVVLSTLGRQGSIGILESILRLVRDRNVDVYCVLLSEILPFRLKPLASFTDAFIQVGCPRLSLDWGHHYDSPLLTPFEAFAAFGGVEMPRAFLPMDFYSRNGGPWSNYGVDHRMGSQQRHELDRRELLRRKRNVT